MPSSNPVYQPTTTTVTYERHKEWSANYLTDTVIPNCHQKPCLQRLLLFGAIILAIVGLGLAVYALIADANAHKEDAADVDLSLDDNSDENEENAESESFDQNDTTIMKQMFCGYLSCPAQPRNVHLLSANPRCVQGVPYGDQSHR